jgi:hypothetical protein
MKSKSILLAAALSVFATTTATSFAAGDAPAGKTEASKSENGEAKKPMKKKVKKHSHMEEKTGMPMSEPMPDMGKEMPKDRHDHTKEKH